LKAFQEPATYSWDALGEQVLAYFLNWEWVLFFLILLLVLVTLISLLVALVQGGVCSSLWEFARRGKRPTLESFFAGGKANLIPLVCLQALLFLLGLVFFMATMSVFGILGLLGFFVHSSFIGLFFVCFFLGLPSVFLWIACLFLLGAYGQVCMAHLTSGAFAKDFGKAFKEFNQGKERSWFAALLTLLWEQLRITTGGMVEAYGLFKANRWRVAVGMVVSFLLFIVLMFALGMVFGILRLIPLLGLILFLPADLLIRWSLSAMSEVYFPALAIGLLAEDE